VASSLACRWVLVVGVSVLIPHEPSIVTQDPQPANPTLFATERAQKGMSNLSKRILRTLTRATV
jgi:hypothetical protein